VTCETSNRTDEISKWTKFIIEANTPARGFHVSMSEIHKYDVIGTYYNIPTYIHNAFAYRLLLI